MAPVKFADISKVATEVIDDDYHSSGYQLKNKAKTSWDGAVVTATVDMANQNPAKLSWKFPKPFGLKGVAVDKFEMDKGGKFKFEAALDKDLHGVSDLKVEAKSNLEDFEKSTLGLSYTGIADSLVTLDTSPLKPDNFNLEVTRKIGGSATMGVKCSMSNLTAPDIGLRFQEGAVFTSLLATKSFGVFSGHAMYKVSDDLKVGGCYEYGSKAGKCCFGIAYNLSGPGSLATSVKAKIDRDQTVSTCVKHQIAKGTTLLAGAKYNAASSAFSYGMQVSLE